MGKFAIFAGHGGTDSGATGNGFMEKDVALEVSIKSTSILKSMGHEVVNNRTSDITSGINQKANLANIQNVDAVVDIHLNANNGTPATGTEVIHSITGGKGKELAQVIVHEISALGYKNRGIKTRTNESGQDYFGIIRQTKAPAVIVETAFINNPEDMAKYDVGKMAQAIVNGIVKTFGLSMEQPTNGIPYPTPVTNIQKGSKDDCVKWIQQALVNKGYDVGKSGVDGIFGSNTDEAVRQFQKDKSLTIDGIVGPKTKAALEV